MSATTHRLDVASNLEPAPTKDTGCSGGHCCCGHTSAAPQAIDLAAVGVASPTRAIYRIMNMDCPMEETLIRKKLGNMPGITGLEFNLMQRVLTVSHTLPSTAPIEEALTSIDMNPEPVGQQCATLGAQDANCPPAPQIPWGRMAVAGTLAAASEAFELFGEWNVNPFGIDLHSLTIGGFAAAEMLPMVLALTAILVGGLGTYRKGWIAIKNFNLNINALMSVAVTGAVIIGQYPEAAMVMVLFGVAEAIEAKALDHARNAIKKLMDLAPQKATVQAADGSWQETEIRHIAVDSRVRVRPGERVALDGLVLSGQSAVNQAPITGESMPVEKGVGDTVYAGSINESGSFEFKVTAGADNSTLARIIHAVQEAQGRRAPIQRFVDQFAAVYTPAIFLAALLTAIIPPLLLGGSWSEWVYTALVILVIGCPCALVLSTPVSIVSGMAAATRHGILIKGGAYLEQGRKLRCLALDKTGTITNGKPRQTDFIKTSGMTASETAVLAAGLAARSDHPVSRAIAENAAENKVNLPEVSDFAAIPGRGVSGVINGHKWYLGNHRLVEELKKCSTGLEETIFSLEKQGKSVVALINDAGVQGLFAVADTLKHSSIEAIKELKKLGVRTVMLTGDNEHTARVIAEQAGVDEFKGNLLPEHKLAEIEVLAKYGKVGMAGDGINDAPALARADVGFAMGAAGADTAIETADVALMDDDLGKIPRFINLSKATYAILAQNIALALGIKALFFALALTGQATMWMAVFADMGTSLMVVANGLRAMNK